MSVHTIAASDLLQRLHEFDTVIDARTESEFALDHLPGAVNWPTLNNEERIAIGTMYVQVSPFEAKKRGAAVAARNIATHIDRDVIDKPRDWKPLAYCWRGGKRSGSLSLVLGQIGFRVTMVEGGYKAFRAAIVANTAHLVTQLQWRVVCGTTGSGKTRLLHALAAQGAQVLDLEGLANHRSSVLGAIPGLLQPSQKRFDTLIWDTLRRFDPGKPVYVESESKKVGNVAVPMCLIETMRASPCIHVGLPQSERVALLLEDYVYFVENTERFCERLQILTEIRGKATVQAWMAQVRAGQIAAVVNDLLAMHYDPGYHQSMLRNFVQFAQATRCSPRSRSMDDIAEAGKQLLGA